MSEATASHAEQNRSQLKEKAAVARDAVADLAAEAKNYAADRISTLKNTTTNKLKSTNETVVDFVEHNPYKAIAIAAGIGVIVGMLLKRK